ncbi:MAG: ABC transporter substrate-binding protein, partial [Rhodoplanes sp.]
MRTAFGIAAALVAWLAAANGPARADDIKIGEINSYSGLPAFTEPYRKGWQLALDELNAKGGVNGKQLVVISKD